MRLKGKTAIVTGATSGLGTETVRVLAMAGADVVLAVRNTAAGERVAAQLRQGLGPEAGTLTVLHLDLSDLSTVLPFADAFRERFRHLHLLINNAGIMAVPKAATAQGFESQVGTNHLGHFALAGVLLPLLKSSAPSRLVALSSAAHTAGNPARLKANLAGQDFAYSPWGVYGDSKLANILFVKALAKRLPEGVEAFAVHPGVILTNLSQGMGFLGVVFRAFGLTLGRFFMKSVPQGAATTVYAATAPELNGQSGAYLSDCALARPIPAAEDPDLAEAVWMESERCVKGFVEA